jgi:hypothetical protein
MQMTLNNEEIIEAVNDFVAKQGINITHKKTEVAMIAGRGGNGFSATVSIINSSTTLSKAIPNNAPVVPEPEESTAIATETNEEEESLFGN